MASERLSKLQRAILRYAAEGGLGNRIGYSWMLDLSRADSLQGRLGVPPDIGFFVSVSRSIRNLEAKEIVSLEFSGERHPRAKVAFFEVTPKGWAIIEKLGLNAKAPQG
jgi:hypothetical protein